MGYPNLSFRTKGWRAELTLFLAVIVFAVGAVTVTAWTGRGWEWLFDWLGASASSAAMAGHVAASLATAGLIAMMLLLGRWSRETELEQQDDGDGGDQDELEPVLVEQPIAASVPQPQADERTFS